MLSEISFIPVVCNSTLTFAIFCG